jgi:hypothetical protein
LSIGKLNSRYIGGPVDVCLTANQREKLFDNETPREIGRGVFATAYADPRDHDTVVKITRDEYDVGGLLKAQGTGLVPTVRGAFKLRQAGKTNAPGKAGHGQKQTLYALKVERLRPLSPYEKAAVDDVLPAVLDGLMYSGDVPAVEVCGSEGAAKKMCIETLNLGRSLHAQGIKWYDAHPGNLGRDAKGRLQALDVGLSRVQPEKLRMLKGRRRARRPGRPGRS